MRVGPRVGQQLPDATDGGSPVSPVWLRRIDLVILPVVFLFDILVFSRLLRIDDVTPSMRVAIVCYSAVGVGLLVFRRLAPVIVFAALWVHSVLGLLFSEAYFPVLLLLVALEAVAELRSLAVSLVALAATVVPTGLLVVAAYRNTPPAVMITAAIGSAVFYLFSDTLAWGIGRWAGRHRMRLQDLAAEHTRQVEEERELAEHAVSQERLRIARELHDIVAHSVTIMVLHAAGAKRIVDSDPARAKESLATIEESGQQAMGELRRLLDLLRETDSLATRSGSPLPGLDQVEQLIQSVGGSGVQVTLEVHGRPRRLDASIDLAAYRLVQEALTNVTRHCGPGARATVAIEWEPEKMTVTVEDDGVGASRVPPSLSTGSGLTGLRERIAIAGGDFAAGPTETGGFRVAARLPVSTTSAPDPEPADGHDEVADTPAGGGGAAPSGLGPDAVAAGIPPPAPQPPTARRLPAQRPPGPGRSPGPHDGLEPLDDLPAEDGVVAKVDP